MKGDKSYSILRLKCPRCHEASLFTSRNSYNLRSVLTMPDRCPACNQSFVVEPGFYSGALWISFPIIVVIALLFYFVLEFVFHLSFEWMSFLMAVCILGLQPLVMRYSRAIWINLFVNYNPVIAKRVSSKEDKAGL